MATRNKTTKPKLSWDDLYQAWKGEKFPYFSERDYKFVPDFREVALLWDKGWVYYHDALVSWWPLSDFDRRLRHTDSYGPGREYWNNPPGPNTVAWILWHCRNNEEAFAAGWLRASFWQWEKHHPQTWTRDTMELLREAESLIPREMEGVDLQSWSANTHYTLPFSILEHQWLASKTPTSYRDLIRLSFMEYLLHRATWVLIHYTKKEPKIQTL